jgi:hypothetical protein
MSFSHTAPRIEIEDLQKEIQNLDDETKEQLQKDLYGEETFVEETTEILNSSLARLHEELEAIEEDEKETFLRAQQECPVHVNSDNFLLPFLRAEKFNASKAARRIVVYWNEKLRLFGEDHTFGPITLASLQEGDLRVLRDGGLTLVPKDKHGRVMIHGDRGAYHLKENGRDAVVSCTMRYLCSIH